MGLFGRRKKQEEQAESQKAKIAEAKESEVAEASSDSEESTTVDPFAARTTNIFADSIALEKGSGLHRIVQLMHGKGEGQMTLSLKQDGDDMQLRLYNNGVEAESAVVNPDSEWFAPVAALYTEEEQSERGEWNRALIVLNPPVGDEMSVQASFLNTVARTSHNLKYVLNSDTLDQPGADSSDVVASDDAANVPTTGVNEILTPEQVAAYRAKQDGVAEVAEAEDSESVVVSEVAESEEVSAAEAVDEEDSSVEQAAPEVEDQSEVSEDAVIATADDQATEEGAEGQPEEALLPEVEAVTESEEAESEDRETAEGSVTAIPETVDDDAQVTVATTPSLCPAFNSNKDTVAVAEDSSEVEVPEEVKEEMVSDHSAMAPLDEEPELASLPDHIDDWAIDEGTFESAPATASALDVTAVAPRVRVARPSTKKLAEGNLVLTEAEVVSRLMPVQDKLFGAEGTALDAATVLIRVRTLGSYYDALTHVRRNGFWDQQRTFDLIPEDVLKVLELKTASYKEGIGAPLAMSLRFTPGIPPVASFDYSSEQAFVQYNDQLPAQQYIEELRMFPRTGANIPAHMSEALASWAL